MTSGQGPGPGLSPDHARAETYLRLLAEAELRRIEKLPRPDPLAEIGVPAPLRGPVRVALPLGQRAASALQPLAENAARALQPLAENAARTVRPLAEEAARNLQPLADTAARAIQPLTSQLAGVVLPAAEQAAQRLNPLAWRAIGQLGTWRRQASQVTAPLSSSYHAISGHPAERAELSPVEGVRRLGAVAQALALVGEIDHGTADAIMASVETALVARSRFPPHRLWIRSRRGRAQQRSGGPPAGSYLAAPVGEVVPVEPESGVPYAHLVAVVIAPDRAVLVLTGWVAEPEDGSRHRDPWPVLRRSAQPTARDDRGNSYALREDSGWSDGDGVWNSTMRLSPVPPSGTRWLELAMNPGSEPIRVDLTDTGDARTAVAQPGGSPAERLIDAAAMDLLYATTGGRRDGAPWHDLPTLAEIVTALEAVGAIEPARDAVGRLVTLADRIGADVPPALRAAAVPRDLPAAWASVLENSHLQDGPTGVAPAATVLPELDGTRFVLAGLRSDPSGAKLFAMAWGSHRMFGLPHYSGMSPWSWWARDDQGRWHVLARGSSGGSSDHADLELHLRPALHPRATSLEVILAGTSGQVSATVPLDWRQP